jgi:hypothetical protein
MDLHQEITRRSAEYLSSEKFSEALQKQVEETIHEAVKQMFSYGDIRDSIRAGLKENVAIDLQAIDFPHINQVVTDLVKKKCHAAFNGPLLEKLAKELDEMFRPAPAEITLQGLVDIWKEDLVDECSCDGIENILVEVSRRDSDRNDGSATIKVWNGGKKTQKSYYSSSDERTIDPDLHIYVIEGKIRLIHDLMAEKGRNSLATNIYNKEAQIFMMYCAGTVITDLKDYDDGSELDTSVGRH